MTTSSPHEPPPSTPSSAQLLVKAFQGAAASIWHDTLRSVVVDALVGYAREHIDIATGCLDDQFGKLDDAATRATVVLSDSALVSACSEALLLHRSELNCVLREGGRYEQSKNELRVTLIDHGVVQSLLAAPASVGEIAEIDLIRVWASLADRIAGDLYEKETAASTEPEWLVHNQLLLARFFRECRVTRATQIADRLNSMMIGLHGPRGAFIAIIERVSPDGIQDRPVPSAPHSSVSLASASGYPSNLCDAIESEALRIPSGNGFMHRLADPFENRDTPSRLQGVFTADQLAKQRSRSYQQYESTLLSYAVLSAVEQLLRACAAHTNVPHIKNGGYPAPVLEWIDDSRMSLGPAMRTAVQDLYASTGPNIRNRAMHSGLLEIESKRLEILIEQLDPSAISSSANSGSDALIPENMLKLLLDRFSTMRQHAKPLGLKSQDFAWTNRIWLSAEELGFGNSIHCDVLDDTTSALAWQQQLFGFVSASVPTLSIFTKLAWVGWMKPYATHDSLLSFIAWGLVFEGLYRITAQLLGFDIIQRSRLGDAGRMFQYRTLDARESGLCRTVVLDALTHDLQPSERPNAIRTIQIAVKARNALAHGAVLRFNENDHLAAGHIFIKAVQLLMCVSLRHMTRVRAYFRGRNKAPGTPSDPIGDWLSSEPETLSMIRDLVTRQRGRAGE